MRVDLEWHTKWWTSCPTRSPFVVARTASNIVGLRNTSSEACILARCACHWSDARASEEASRLLDTKGFDLLGLDGVASASKRRTSSLPRPGSMRPNIPARRVALAIWLRDEVKDLSIALRERHRPGTSPRPRVVYFAFFRLPEGAAVIPYRTVRSCRPGRVTHLLDRFIVGLIQNSRGRRNKSHLVNRMAA